MSKFSFFLFFAGVVLIGISVFRATRRRQQRGGSYSDYINKTRLKQPAKSEFGRDIKWVINEKRDSGHHSGGAEPPPETGG